MQGAINEFSGTPEEMRITIANVDLALSKGNVDLRWRVQSITPKQPCYMDAKEKMASTSICRPTGRPPLYRVLPVSPGSALARPCPQWRVPGVFSPDRLLCPRASQRVLRSVFDKSE